MVVLDIKLVKTTNTYQLTVLTLVCNNRKLDSTYVIKNLFGNLEYSIQVLKPGGKPFSPSIENSITPLADSINNFDVLF